MISINTTEIITFFDYSGKIYIFMIGLNGFDVVSRIISETGRLRTFSERIAYAQ